MTQKSLPEASMADEFQAFFALYFLQVVHFMKSMPRGLVRTKGFPMLPPLGSIGSSEGTASGDENVPNRQESSEDSSSGEDLALQEEVFDRQDRLKRLREFRKRDRIADGSGCAATQKQLEKSLTEIQGCLKRMDGIMTPRPIDAVPFPVPPVKRFGHKRSRAVIFNVV